VARAFGFVHGFYLCVLYLNRTIRMLIHQDSADQYHVLGNVETPQGSRNMGLDPTNHRVFVVSAKFGPVPAGGRGRGPVLPGSFTLMVIERDPAAH
jgi:hypothetical protein